MSVLNDKRVGELTHDELFELAASLIEDTQLRTRLMDAGVIPDDHLEVPFLIWTDSYKAQHFEMYPDVEEMSAFFCARGPLSPEDHRIVFLGMRYAYHKIIKRRITWRDIEAADKFMATHGVGKTNYRYPRDLWVEVVEKHNGYLPLEIRALPEGSVVLPNVPCFTMTGKSKFARLTTWFESVLMHIWSPTTTATKSRMVKDILEEAYEESVEDQFFYLLRYALHDFGLRGVSSLETAITTGLGHLMSFEGSDNMPACWLATQFNDGRPRGESVTASEHSVMTSWSGVRESRFSGEDDAGELAAIKHLISIAQPGSILSVVADSYNYSRFVWEYLPIVAPLARAKNILFVTRPDSGDPVQAVLEGLRASEHAFGASINSKGYKVLNGAAVIQGDGIDSEVIKEIAKQVLHNGYAIQNVVFGMGGGLLQKQHRDTLKVAIKLSFIVYAGGTTAMIMKAPAADADKASLPGLFAVVRVDGVPTVFPREWGQEIEGDELKVIWDCGPVEHKFTPFDEDCERMETQWKKVPRKAHPLSPEMRKVRDREFNKIRGLMAAG